MRKIVLSFVAALLMVVSSRASHQVAGDIGWTCLGNNVYEFYVYFYYDCDGSVGPPSAMSLNAASSCGNFDIILNPVDLSPNDPSTFGIQDSSSLCDQFRTTCQGGPYPGIEIYQYVGQATLVPCADWVFCADDCCRNATPTGFGLTAITTYTGSTSMAYAGTLNNADGACDDSPIWNKPPRAFVCQDILTNMDNGCLLYTSPSPRDA